jgi:hypothetical protein
MSDQQVSDRGTRNVTAHNGDIGRRRPRADFRRSSICLGPGFGPRFGNVTCRSAVVRLSCSRHIRGQSRRQDGSRDRAGGFPRCHANGFAETERLFGYHLPASCSRDICHSHRGVVDGQASCAQAGSGMRAHGQRIDRSRQTTRARPLRHLIDALCDRWSDHSAGASCEAGRLASNPKANPPTARIGTSFLMPMARTT